MKGIKNRFSRMFGMLSALVALGAVTGIGTATAENAGTITLTFIPHAAFFSRETHQKTAIDPQVFIREPSAPASIGPQNIPHVAGFAPAPLGSPTDTPLFSANGKPLDLTAGAWFEAHGSAIVVSTTGGAHISAAFSGLIPNGMYSLFRVTFSPSGNSFAPFDGSGTSNSFTASNGGTGSLVVSTPTPLTHATAILLVYHSDGTTHGMKRGKPGVTAHHQLIARLP